MPDTASLRVSLDKPDNPQSSAKRSNKIVDFPSKQHQSATKPMSAAPDWSYATQELLDTLPPVWTRGLLYVLVVFAAVLLVWSMLFKVDVTGAARGRIEPQDRTFRIDAPAAGTVARVFVGNGEQVVKNQPLLELESETLRSELQRLETKREGQQTHLGQLELLKEQMVLTINAQAQQNQARALEKAAQIEQARQNLSFLIATYELQKEEKRTQLAQANQQLDYSRSAHNLAESRLDKALREVERFRKAQKKGAVAEIRVLQQEDVVEERRQARNQEKLAFEQAKLRLDELDNSLRSASQKAASDIERAKFFLEEQERGYQSIVQAGELAILRNEEQRKDYEARIAQLEAEIAQSISEQRSLQFQLEKRVVRAPVDGTIFEMPVYQSGMVVQSGTTIAEIAPRGSSLVLRAQINTMESGSLRLGMPVKVKFDAYPFQDFGIVDGTLSRISPTSRIAETPQGLIATYELDIVLASACIGRIPDCIHIRPGDTGTAEVIARQRRVIDFVLNPFKKLQAGGIEL